MAVVVKVGFGVEPATYTFECATGWEELEGGALSVITDKGEQARFSRWEVVYLKE